MVWLLLLLFPVLAVADAVWSQRFAQRLASYSTREYQVAGLDRDDVVGTHHTWGLFPWNAVRVRRRLEKARRDVAAFESRR
ncbi:hypothetical protein [Nocardioides bruguierae]|uniref:Uncharacterized protein n=1 Tax=Nocardioides bruguierae TaxID=2945102 RepID=A0A9X2DA12_9ACTN|nr:hypothetical protein [Nocardioides bruguierae]MCM0621916.1 hypothetical protein [Nocardioides bruguierae]